MAQRVANSTILISVDWTPIAGPTVQVLNKWTVDDPTSPGLTKDDASAQRPVTASELSGTLLVFLQALLKEAKTQDGIS